MKFIPHTRSIHIFHGDRLWLDPQWKLQLEKIGIKHKKDWTRLASDQPVSGSYHTTNTFRFSLEDGQAVYFKRYVYRRFRLKYWLQPSKAAVEVAGYHDLKKLGINTARVLAYGEKRRWGLLRAACILTLGIPDTIELSHYLAREWFYLAYAEKQVMLKQLQPQLIQQLHIAHNAGFYHWDLKLRNILLRQTGAHTELIWIDCPRSRHKNPNDEKAVLNDLVGMARVGLRVLTPGQRLRFLIDYTHGDVSHARSLYRAIANTQKKNPPRPFWQLLPKDDPIRVAQSNKRGFK